MLGVGFGVMAFMGFKRVAQGSSRNDLSTRGLAGSTLGSQPLFPSSIER